MLAQSQADPRRLDLARERDADYKSITLKEINRLARTYLPANRALLVTIRPEPSAGDKTPDAPGNP